MWDQGVTPGLATIGRRVVGGMLAPLYRGVAFASTSGLFISLRVFGFQHGNGCIGLGDKIGLIFKMLDA